MPNIHNIFYVLDQLSSESLTQWNERSRKIKEYVHQNYFYFAQKRSEMFPVLIKSLLSACEQYQFTDWQRVVSYRYAFNPLSARGSLNNSIGGRFNIGNINPTLFPPFGALYIAENRDTAIREKYGLPKPLHGQDGLSSRDLNLTKKESETSIVISGNVNLVLNLCNNKSLSNFFAHINKIKHPQHLFKLAKELSILPTKAVKTLNQLYQTVLEENWRYHANQCNIPANSQVLGQIAYEAGIEAILYPSTKDSTQCMAVFPRNFKASESFIKINDNHAPKEIDQDALILNKDTYLKLL